jgi:hypothetical protein
MAHLGNASVLLGHPTGNARSPSLLGPYFSSKKLLETLEGAPPGRIFSNHNGDDNIFFDADFQDHLFISDF